MNKKLVVIGTSLLAILIVVGIVVGVSLSQSNQSQENTADKLVSNTDNTSQNSNNETNSTNDASGVQSSDEGSDNLILLLSKYIWVDTSDSNRNVTFAQNEINIVSDNQTKTIQYTINEVGSQEMSNNEETITRWTGKVSSGDREYDLTLDINSDDSSQMNVTCDLLGGSGIYIAQIAHQDLQVSNIRSEISALIDGKDQDMRQAIANYCSKNIPTAITATCGSWANIDYGANTVSVPWTISASGNLTLYATYSKATGEISVNQPR